MIPQDNLIDIFLFNPCEESYNEITDKKVTLRLLREQKDTARKLHFLRKKGDKILRYDIIALAIKENQIDIFNSIVNSVKHKSDFLKVLHLCVKNNRLDMMEILIDQANINDRVLDYEKLAKIAARNGHIDLLKSILFLYTQVHQVIQSVAAEAAESGHINIVKMLVRGVEDNGRLECAKNWKYLIIKAIEGDHIDIVDYLVDVSGCKCNEKEFASNCGSIKTLLHIIEKWSPISDKEEANILACNIAKVADMDSILYFIEKGAYDFKKMTKSAVMGDNRELVTFLVSKIKPSLSTINEFARLTLVFNKEERKNNNYKEIINDFLEMGANNFEEIAMMAIGGGYLEIAKEMDNRDSSIYWPYSIYEIEKFKAFNDINIIDFLLDKGVNSKYCTNFSATYHGRVDILKKTKEFTKQELEYYISLAVSRGHRNIVDYLYEFKKAMRFNCYMSY